MQQWHPGFSWEHGWAQSGTGLLNLGTVDILGWQIPCCGDHSVHCEMFSSIYGLYPLDASSMLWQLKYLQTLLNVPCRQNCLQERATGQKEGRVGSVWKPCSCFDGLGSIWGPRKGLVFTVSLINVCQITVYAQSMISHISECGFMPLFWLICDRWSHCILFTIQGSILNGSWNIWNYWLSITGFALLETMYWSILLSPGM